MCKKQEGACLSVSRQSYNYVFLGKFCIQDFGEDRLKYEVIWHFLHLDENGKHQL